MNDKLTVLVADDSKVIRKAFSRVMRDHYELIEAEDGQVAWEMIEGDDEICAVFTDWEMPGMDGPELTRKIRESKNPRIRSLPVIMVTSKTEDEATKKEAFDAGVNDFVAKPFDTAELLARAKVHVKRIDPEGDTETDKAVLDPGSRIGNAQYFQEQGNQMVAFANRHNLPLSLVLVGIDGLAELRQKHGASERQMEELAQTIGGLIASTMRKEDSLARVGRGVYGVLLSSTDLKLAHRFAERVQKTTAKEHLMLAGDPVEGLTVSVGLEATEPSRKRKLPGLLKTARERLLLAGRTGNTIRPSHFAPDKQLRKLDSLDKALSLVANKRADNVDLVYLMKRLFPLLVHYDKTMKTDLAKQALSIIKGEKK
ncbi:MAG: GGDEF domain-containing response regulator [Pseudomonadota bacterium]